MGISLPGSLSSFLFSQGNHEAFHFKGLLLITTGEKKSAPKPAVTINTGKLQTWRNPSKFTQHWSPGYSYGFLLKWYLKTTFDFCSFFLFLKLEPIKSSTSQHRHSDHLSAIRTFDSEQLHLMSNGSLDHQLNKQLLSIQIPTPIDPNLIWSLGYTKWLVITYHATNTEAIVLRRIPQPGGQGKGMMEWCLGVGGNQTWWSCREWKPTTRPDAWQEDLAELCLSSVRGCQVNIDYH